MIKWKLNIYILIFLLSYLLIYVNCQIDIEDDIKQREEYYRNLILEPGKIQMKYLRDSNRNPFQFQDEGINNDLLVNFYSLNCLVELGGFESQSVSSMQLNENAISMRIKKDNFQNANIIIQEKVNLINGINKYKNKKNCPLMINTIKVNYLTLEIEEKEPTNLYFDKNFLDNINLVYKNITVIKNRASFITLSFSFNEVSTFNIIIPDIINTNISNSTTIFLDQESLLKIKGDTLNIRIEHIDTKYPCSLIFQIFEDNTIYILQRHYINKGFIDSNSSNQYYYMEVFQEEGEIMLHNKRNNGKLFGLIKPKDEVSSPFNSLEYLKNENNNELEFNEHTQKLSFNSSHTKKCNKGCYLLMTYYNENINGTNQ